MNIKIESLTSTSIAESADLLAGVFRNLEPMTAALHFSPEFYSSYIRSVCEHGFEDGLAVGARDWELETHPLVGIALGLDEGKYRQTLQLVPPPYRAEMEEMNDFFEELDKPLSLLRGKWTYVFYLAVAPTHWRAGISLRMLDRLEHLLHDKRYEYLVSETTNPKSEGAFRKRGYTLLNQLTYAKHLYKGDYPFARIPGECSLFLKKIA